MKSITISYKKNILLYSGIILMALLLVLGFYSVCNSGMMEPCEAGSFCGDADSVGASNSYVNIPILNNHHPATVTITQLHIEAPATPCAEEAVPMPGAGSGYRCQCNAITETRLKEIKFDDTVAFNASTSYCVCTDSTDHTGHTFSLDTDYSFSDAKVLCRLTLDVVTAPSGLYTVIYYYTVPGSVTVRENTLTFTIP